MLVIVAVLKKTNIQLILENKIEGRYKCKALSLKISWYNTNI
jgi:hypothetical protein